MARKQVKESTQPTGLALVTGRIDSDYGHFAVWDLLCANSYPDADFATFPRGRVLFDIKNGEHILYADRCITDDKIKEIATLFYADKYRVERDEHYACDQCLKRGRSV